MTTPDQLPVTEADKLIERLTDENIELNDEGVEMEEEIKQLSADLEAAKEALSSLAERAGALVVATDGMEHIRSERLAVLAASTAATDFLERLSCED